MTSSRHKPSSAAPAPRADSTRADSSPADDAYLDAAREVILAVGWSRATLTDIARRAGVSRMTLYRRWPDTQTLLADLMTREWGRVVTVADPGADADPLRRIADGVVATVQGLRENELLRRIVDVDPERLLPYLLDRRGRSQDLLAAGLAAVVREGQQAGTVRTGDADVLARSLLLACHGFALSAHTMTDAALPPKEADVSAFDRELRHLVERFLRP